jgi:hypothetical protein
LFVSVEEALITAVDGGWVELDERVRLVDLATTAVSVFPFPRFSLTEAISRLLGGIDLRLFPVVETCIKEKKNEEEISDESFHHLGPPAKQKTVIHSNRRTNLPHADSCYLSVSTQPALTSVFRQRDVCC